MKAILGSISALFFVSLALFGCSKTSPEGVAAPSVAVGNGKAVFEASNCGNCHGPGKNAPDLSKIGGEHDAIWIVAHVKNPKVHNPGSRMPGYEGKISETDLQAMGSYLASLK